MSEQYLITGQTLTNIADAIREKAGTTDPIMAGDFAEKIEGLQTGANIKTCTVTVNVSRPAEFTGGGYLVICYEQVANGELTTGNSKSISPGTSTQQIENVPLGSLFTVFTQFHSDAFNYTTNNMESWDGNDSPSNTVTFLVAYDGELIDTDSCELNITLKNGFTHDATATAQDIIENTSAYVKGGKINGALSDYRGASLDGSLLMDDWDGEEITYLWDDTPAVVNSDCVFHVRPSEFLPSYHYVYSSGLSYTDDGFIDLSSDDGSLDGLDDNTIESAFGVVHDAAGDNYYFMFVAGTWCYTYCGDSSGVMNSGATSADNCYPYNFLENWQIDPTGYLASESTGCNIEVVYYVKS